MSASGRKKEKLDLYARLRISKLDAQKWNRLQFRIGLPSDSIFYFGVVIFLYFFLVLLWLDGFDTGGSMYFVVLWDKYTHVYKHAGNYSCFVCVQGFHDSVRILSVVLIIKDHYFISINSISREVKNYLHSHACRHKSHLNALVSKHLLILKEIFIRITKQRWDSTLNRVRSQQFSSILMNSLKYKTPNFLHFQRNKKELLKIFNAFLHITFFI